MSLSDNRINMPIQYINTYFNLDIDNLPRSLVLRRIVYSQEIILPTRTVYSQEIILPTRTVYSQEIILPTFTEKNLMIPDDAVCGISLEKKPDCITSCGHHFFRAEITKWLEQQKNECKKMSCPTCRAEITQVFVIQNK